MIPKHIDEINYGDLLSMVNAVPEGRTIEYKSELPHEGESKKIPFLAEISAFANTIGGDLIFGIEEKNGIAVNVPGIKVDNLDKEILRLESSIQNGIEPRISDIVIKSIKLPSGNYVLIIRVGRSWNAPHRVSYKDHAKVYGRNSAGKYPLDVSELRTAFTLSEIIPERIRRFREDRVTSILTNSDLPVNLVEGGRIVLHVIPLSAFTTKTPNIITPTSEYSQYFRPLGASGWNHRLNIEGIVNHNSIRDNINTYAQIYRSGIIETLASLQPIEGKQYLPSVWYEKQIIEACQTYTASLNKFGIQPPLYFFLSFLNMKGFEFGTDSMFFGGRKLDRDIILFPEVVLESLSDNTTDLLRSTFDMVWNAFGYERSMNYKEDGSWGK